MFFDVVFLGLPSTSQNMDDEEYDAIIEYITFKEYPEHLKTKNDKKNYRRRANKKFTYKEDTNKLFYHVNNKVSIFY